MDPLTPVLSEARTGMARADDAATEFYVARPAERRKVSFLNEFWLFLRVRKKFWLLPIFLVMAVFGLLVLAVFCTA
jgi:Family of unknown function (DUF5989)